MVAAMSRRRENGRVIVSEVVECSRGNISFGKTLREQ